MKKISKLFFTSLVLFSQGMCSIFGQSDFSNSTFNESVKQSATVSEEIENDLSGTYVGSYTEFNNTHGVNLEISKSNGTYNAIFSFYPLSYSEEKASGSFSMKIEKNDDDTYNFIQDYWILQPEGYLMVDLLNCKFSNCSINGMVCKSSTSSLVQIGSLFVTTVNDICGIYEGCYQSPSTTRNLILTISNNYGKPAAFFFSTSKADFDDARVASFAMNIVPVGVHGNYDFIADDDSAILSKGLVVCDLVSCSIHNNILTGVLTVTDNDGVQEIIDKLVLKKSN